MTHDTSHTPQDQNDTNFEPSSIFIAREKQLELFNYYLERWKRLLVNANPDLDTPMIAPPTPQNKIQGLVVLLFGRGGFGKSTLLKHYWNLAQEKGRNITVSAIVDWEFAVEGKRGLFNPPTGQEVDPFEYFRVLYSQLVLALGRKPQDFRGYQTAMRNVEKARKEASSVLDRMQNDDRYAVLRGVTVDTLAMLLSTITPAPVGSILETDIFKGVANEGMKIGIEQLAQIRAKLRDELGSKLEDYLDAPTRLGFSLGRDLARFARNFPHLIFFDTYEEVDSADRLLRIVMGAAGIRVGWVLAGRDNLWGGALQRKRSIPKEYGYKDMVFADRGLPVDFNRGGVGSFTLNDIMEYFEQICSRVQYEAQLPKVTREEAKNILDVTQGVPLAVTIAAGLYVVTANLELVTEKTDNKRQIVDQMVERYLLHAHDDQSERAKLYGLAMLRRPDLPVAIAAALGLTPEQAKTGYESELSRLHRRFSFIFTEKELPSLHQEVRHFLRLWLLEHRRDPEIVAVNKGLYEAQEEALKQLEEQMAYTSLRERLQDEEWVGMYLDLTEQQFWLDPVKGVSYSIPFMIAAAIYRKDINEDVVIIGKFFESQIRRPYNDWWNWATESLTHDFFRFRHTANMLKSTSKQQIKADTSGFIIILMLLVLFLTSKLVNKSKTPNTLEIQNSDEMLIGLEKLEELVEKRGIGFPSPLPKYHDELAAALWWRLGESYEDRDAYKAYEWYEKALTRLYHVDELREADAETCVNMAHTLDEQDRHTECIQFLNRAIELKPDYAMAYTFRGTVYTVLEDYTLAIRDYNQAISLDPKDAEAYKSRGEAYDDLEEFQRSIEDYNRAIELSPEDTTTYHSRGVAYDHLRQYDRAIIDYDRAIGLDPLYTVAYNDRGNAYAGLKDYERAVQDYDRAIELHQSYADAYSNRGMAHLWLKNLSQSADDYSRSLDYNPADIDSAWMAEWVRMDKHRAGQETAERLERIAAMQPEDYIAYISRGVAFGLHGNVKDGLGEVDKAIELGQEECDAYFWKGMLSLYFYRGTSQTEIAREALEISLKLGLPPILLTPLYWLEEDIPEVFEKYVKPLLIHNGM